MDIKYRNMDARLLMHVVLLLLTSYSLASAQEEYKGQKGMYSIRPAERWEDALISGNGTMGIMVYGDPVHEKIIFNHELLYEPIGSENVEPPDIAKYLDQTRELFKQEKYEEAIQYSYKMALEEGYAGLQWTDPYHPALRMEIDQKFVGEPLDYTRSINFETGEILVKWKSNGVQHSRRSFVSRSDGIILQLIENDQRKVDCSIRMAMQGEKKNDWAEHRDKPKGFDDPLKKITGDWLTFRVHYRLNEKGYEVVTKVYSPGTSKRININNNNLEVRSADYVLLISKIVALEDFNESRIQETKEIINSLNPDYEELVSRHSKIHSEIFNRVDLDIYPDNLPKHSSEELIKQQKSNPNAISSELLETMFYMGRYALLSSSGSNPPNLMGIWNGQWRPAWSGDFTTDANINLQISSANICNMPEAIDSYMQMLERIAPDWEINAMKLYGCRGYLAGTRTSGQRNLHTHFNIGFPGHFWLAGAEWLLLPCYEYYQVSGDREFLIDRLLPMLEKTALFFEDFLTSKDEHEHFFFAPSYSPENRPANIKVSATVNAVMDIAAAKEVFNILIDIYSDLNIHDDKIAYYKDLISQLPPYLINNDGALKEWAWDGLEDNYNHRHVSHLYPVWPGHEINPEETPELFTAAAVAAKKRGSGNDSAHGLTHMALIGARLKMPDLVQHNLTFLLSNDFLYNGLFTSHNPNLRIFNSDALCSFPAVVGESLVYSRPQMIEILPAWSREQPSGSIRNIPCRTQAVVKELIWDLEKGVVECSVLSNKKQTISLINRHYDITWTERATSVNVKSNKGEAIEVSFEKGEVKSFILNIEK